MLHIFITLSSIIGLFFDIIGAFFIAYEVVQKYNGKKYNFDSMALANYMKIPYSPSDEEIETNDFQKWQKRRSKNMKVGLIFLVIGFIFQITGNLPCL